MKKFKNTELKQVNSSLERVKEGKIKKNQQKKDKKLKNAVSIIEELTLSPKKSSTNLGSKSDCAAETKKKGKKDKSAIKKKNQESSEGQQTVANNENKSDKEKKQESKINKENATEKTTTKEFTEAELVRVERKKTKKLVQKLKKRQRKEQNLSLIANGVKITKTLEAIDAKNVDATISDKVIKKKEKKVDRRQMVKDKKLAGKQPRDPAIEAATVFVGNLPVSTKRKHLVRLFKDFGPINFIRIRSAGGNVLYKHKHRKAAGSLNAYVVLKDKEAAEKAVSLNGVELKGHHIRVTLAEKSSGNHEQKKAKRTVLVGNLSYSASDESLREIFSSCGEIDYVRCIRNSDKGCNGVAFVCFKKADAVCLALELNQTILDERPINVERFSVKKLGAKAARDAQAKKEEQSKNGAKQRLNGKKANKAKLGYEMDTSGEVDDAKKPKKSEFRGVKVEGLKKKQKSKKKKSNDQMLQLAKKIAPKIKKTEKN